MQVDNYGFYYTKELDNKKYDLDLGLSFNLEILNRLYIVYHKRKFFTLATEKLQQNMALLTQKQDIDFQFDEEFFKYGLVYYQRNGKDAFLLGGQIDELEIYQPLFNNFGLDLKLRHYLEIHGGYPNLDQIIENIKNADLNQTISFLLALATIYGDWNLVEEDDIYLSNVLIKFPFDTSLADKQDLIFYLEDILVKNKLYNSLTYTKKGWFIWNIKDVDLLEIFGKFLISDKVKDFFQVEEEILPIFNKKKQDLLAQLDNDLRIKLEDLKLTQIEKISLAY